MADITGSGPISGDELRPVVRRCPACTETVRITPLELNAGATRRARCAVTLRTPGTLGYYVARVWHKAGQALAK